MAKVLGPEGFGWASGESLRAQIAMDAMRKELLGASGSPLGFALYDHVGLLAVMAAGTLVIELGAPLALFHRRSRVAWVAGAWLMHIGVLYVMGIDFRYHVWGIAFASFLPIERIARAVLARM